MSIPHLKARAEYYALCLQHGEENVEWTIDRTDAQYFIASAGGPAWVNDGREYKFRVRPRTVVIPEQVVPEEDPDGEYVFMIKARVCPWCDDPRHDIDEALR